MCAEHLQPDSNNPVLLPEKLTSVLGLRPGERLRAEPDGEGWRLRPSPDRLAQVYVEVTNACNIGCRTCVRNSWDEPAGQMTEATYSRLLDGLEDFRSGGNVPRIFFGGFGEPLTHPRLLDWIEQARQRGAEVELISNGVLLDEQTAARLVELGVERVWISLDGATPESYADVRLGAELPRVLSHLESLASLCQNALARTHLGIAFVAMRRNLADLPAVMKLAERLGADQVMVTNVLAYQDELRGEVLYQRSQYESPDRQPRLRLPRMDRESQVLEALAKALESSYRVEWDGESGRPGAKRCPFIEKGSTSVRWDGQVSPCLALLHTHSYWLGERRRKSTAHSFGSLSESSLKQIWSEPAYRALRERVMDFDFSPCAVCNSCEMASANREDCFGSPPPACGGCLWAQGLIQCP